ncbi:THO complex subunit 5 homolog [Mercenaria mercenaria]|uniref:THO complex subunit 5 homolog n=1 Tax=Mercenaria mercenaria TaxID=6596 RepID=UPI00234EFD45|nr:THO complex subunit 5 homolog [Mercenaria mercenaria]
MDVKDEKEKKRKRTIKLDGSAASASGDGKMETKRIKSEPVKIKHEAPSVNIGRKLFYAEEEEVEQRDVNKDVELFQSACGDIQRTIAEIKTLKETKGKNATEEIESKRMEGMLQIVMLKKLNRLAHIRCKKVRDGTNEAKMRIDRCHLQVQNLLYEIMHLEKEIVKCLGFKSKDEEIDLVPVEQFYEEAPEEISKPEKTKDDNHQLTLSRLDWELEQRKQLAEKLKEAVKTKDDIETEIKTKQEHLENLHPKLNTILQSTKPVQEYLDMPFDTVREEHMTAQFLPHPLFVLYMQSSAYKDACDNKMKVTLDGNLDAAKSLDMSAPSILDEESESDQEEQEEQDKKNSKRRRKTVEVKKSESKSKVLTKHPLSVVIQIVCNDGSELHLTFYYLTYLKIITVAVQVTTSSDVSSTCVSGSDILSPDLILDDLYPNDHGTASPNNSNQYELSRFGLKDLSNYVSQVGRPYLWAQRMGGLQFLNGEPPQAPKSSVSSQTMQGTIRKLRKRIQSRLALLKQLNALERNSIPVSSECMGMFPVKLSGHLKSWQRSTYEEFIETPYTQTVVSQGLARELDLYFTAVIERGTAKLTASIVVAPDYPTVAPLFCINILWGSNRNSQNDSHIQELEEEVNIHYEELMSKKSHDQLLTNQLQRLVMCFDVYLETEAQNSSNEGPLEIAKEKVFTRVSRGRQRSKPYKFNPDTGIFSHR